MLANVKRSAFLIRMRQMYTHRQKAMWIAYLLPTKLARFRIMIFSKTISDVAGVIDCVHCLELVDSAKKLNNS